MTSIKRTASTGEVDYLTPSAVDMKMEVADKLHEVDEAGVFTYDRVILEGPHGSTTYERAAEPWDIVVDVPVKMRVTVAWDPVEHAQVSRVTLLPMESDAGHFGRGSTVVSGDMPDGMTEDELIARMWELGRWWTDFGESADLWTWEA